MKHNGVQFPANYSPENALRAAFLTLQETKDNSNKPVLESCSEPSIKIALLKMVSSGLNPMKKQCYFIPKGGKLYCDTSYFGEIAIAKRYGLKDIKANIIWKGDDFNYSIIENGRFKVNEHKQSFTNVGGEIAGAYATIVYPNGTTDTDVMSFDEIMQAWKQGGSKGNSPAHKNFGGEMCKKTVLKRAIKVFINSSDDSDLLNGATPTENYINQEIQENANKQNIGFDEDYEDAEHEEVKEELSSQANDEDEMQKLHDQAMAEEAGQSTMTGPGF